MPDVFEVLGADHADVKGMLTVLAESPGHADQDEVLQAARQDVADYLSIRGYFPTRVFTASRFVLFSSRSSVGGGPYVVEDSYSLSP